jgi:hypothetical protein
VGAGPATVAMLGKRSSGHYRNSSEKIQVSKFWVMTYRKLEILVGEAGGELDGSSEGTGDRDGIRAVDKLARVLSKGLELGHGRPELSYHAGLVVLQDNHIRSTKLKH